MECRHCGKTVISFRPDGMEEYWGCGCPGARADQAQPTVTKMGCVVALVALATVTAAVSRYLA